MFVITYLFSGFVFGWAKPIPVSPYYFKNRQRGMAIVGAAGPITNFILAIVFALILNWVTPVSTAVVFTVLFLLFQINMVLGHLQPHPHPASRRVADRGGSSCPANLYEKWVAVDRYGMLLVIALIVLFQGAFFSILEGAMTDSPDCC